MSVYVTMSVYDNRISTQAAVKECKWATRKLHEMATELTSIGETSSVDALTERMSSCEHDKIETETLLKERVSRGLGRRGSYHWRYAEQAG